MNVDQKSLETEFLIAICRPTGDKWQSKTLFISIFYPCLSIFKSVFDCRLSGVVLITNYHAPILLALHLLLKIACVSVSGRVLDSRPSGCGFKPRRRHCIESLSKTH